MHMLSNEVMTSKDNLYNTEQHLWDFGMLPQFEFQILTVLFEGNQTPFVDPIEYLAFGYYNNVRISNKNLLHLKVRLQFFIVK